MMRSFADLDDMECVALAQRGEQKAFSELVARHQEKIYRFLLRLLRSPEDARDSAQDTFLRAYQSLARWRPDASFKTWLFRIARNIAFDRMRRDRLVAFVELGEDDDSPDPSAGPDVLAEIAQRRQQLEEALQRLHPEHREILLLREIEQMSYDEIGTILSLNAGTVKSRIARARASLLASLQSFREVAR